MDESNKNYALTIEFGNINELIEFFSIFTNKFKKYDKPKKEGDKRGREMKNIHKRAREYKLLHPELSYKECLKNAGKKNILDDNNI